MIIQDIMTACFLPQGTYAMRLLAPKGTPQHTITFKQENGIYQAEVVTEHGPQQARNIKLGDRRISWRQFGGTPGTELFEYDMEIFPGNVLLGKCYRVDVPAEESPSSPVVAEAIEE